MRTGLLADRLQLMFEWYEGMVDERTDAERSRFMTSIENGIADIDRTGDRHDDTKNSRAA